MHDQNRKKSSLCQCQPSNASPKYDNQLGCFCLENDGLSKKEKPFGGGPT
jgi:hypothetical protein